MGDVFTLVGFRHVSYTNKAGKPVSGVNLYFTQEVPEKYGEGSQFMIPRGQIGSSLFVSEEEFKALGLSVGAEYTFSFTMYGSIAKDTIQEV